VGSIRHLTQTARARVVTLMSQLAVRLIPCGAGRVAVIETRSAFTLLRHFWGRKRAPDCKSATQIEAIVAAGVKGSAHAWVVPFRRSATRRLRRTMVREDSGGRVLLWSPGLWLGQTEWVRRGRPRILCGAVSL
jgi:hypothetical protein